MMMTGLRQGQTLLEALFQIQRNVPQDSRTFNADQKKRLKLLFNHMARNCIESLHYLTSSRYIIILIQECMSTKRKFVINFFSCYRNCLLKEKRITLSLGYFIYLNMKNSNYGKSNIHIKTFILFTPYVEHFEFCFFFQS